MSISAVTRRRARYLVPLSAAAITAIVVIAPQAASGAQHPNLPVRTAGQLLASLEQAHTPQFSGTTVETARLGLPSLSANDLPAGVSAGAQSQLVELVSLLTGSHTAQIAYGGPERQRIAVFLSDLSETDVVHNGRDLWTYSSDGNSVSHTTLKANTKTSSAPDNTAAVNPTRAAEQALAEISPSTAVTVDRTAEVAGRSAYQLDLAPRDSRTLISSVRIALDAKTSMPLRVQIWSRNNTKSPAFEVGFTSLSLKAPSPSTFVFTTPPGATVESAPFSERHSVAAPSPGGPSVGAPDAGKERVIGKDWTSVLVDTFTVPSVQSGGGGQFSDLDEFARPVAGGHLITTSLLSIFITNDNRLLMGAVSPQYIEQLAATKAGQ
jgi:outer membrane lipoprotein-sorting protein